MPTFLSDPSTAFYVILGVLTAIAFGIWFRSRKKKDLLVFAVIEAILILVVVCDFAFESPREESSRKLRSMAEASQKKDWNGVFQHVSDKFEYKFPQGQAVNKAGLQQFAKVLSEKEFIGFNFKGFTIVDLSRSNFKELDGGKIQLGFTASAIDAPMTLSYMTADFVKEDGQWKMINFTRYSKDGPAGGEQSIPGLGGN